MSSFKKIACNPPAEEAARSNDLEVCGCFVGLRLLIEALRANGQEKEAEMVTKRTVVAESAYRNGRRQLRATAMREFDEIVQEFAT